MIKFGTEIGAPELVFTDNAVAVMLRFRQEKPRDKEAGGQLFAEFRGKDVIVAEATEPKLLDYRSRYRFEPNRLFQRREIKAKHRDGLHFVGDWHTHPELHPEPSRNDIQSMQDCFRRSGHELVAFVLVIIGTTPPPDGWHVTLVSTERVRQLHFIERN